MTTLASLIERLSASPGPVGMPTGSAGALLLSRFCAASKSPVVILCDTDRTAGRLAAEIAFFGTPARLFPSLDTVAYGRISPDQDVIGARIAALFALQETGRAVVVTTPKAVMEPVIPPDILRGGYVYLLAQEPCDFDELRHKLVAMGYQHVDGVQVPGEYVVKGGIIDVFSPFHRNPVRIEFLGDTVESLRSFDPETQRTTGTVDELYILPVRDFVYTDEHTAAALANLKACCDSRGIAKRLRDEVAAKIEHRTYFAGMEFLLPALYGDRSTFADYAEGAVCIVFDEESVGRELHVVRQVIDEAYAYNTGRGELALPPSDVFDLDAVSRLRSPGSFPVRLFPGDGALELICEDNAEFAAEAASRRTGRKSGERLHPVDFLRRRILERRDGCRTLVALSSRSQCVKIEELLGLYGMQARGIATSYDAFLETARPGDVWITQGRLSGGFKLPGDGLWIITEEEVFGPEAVQTAKKARNLRDFITSLYELNEGDLVVHVDHGIGVYKGLKQVEVGGRTGEFIELEYADEARLFLPVDKINLLQKYIGAEDQSAKVDRLGDRRWAKLKKKVQEDLRKVAAEIIDVEAARRLNEGFGFPVDTVALEEFSASFDFEETDDQRRAIEDVLADMERTRPMDRVICGDVGFGKTEVALRAAFVAASAGKQVAIVAPTTILCEQHYQVFRKRMAAFGIEVAVLSRFVDPLTQRQVLERLKRGEVDVIVGTHRILARDVTFADLGLMIVDEEHKFGVTQKERIKRLKATVDVLTLTATPIPRTLNMSLSGLRDISIVATPPAGRMAIKTWVTRFSDDVIREAVEREVQRGGQVFFVHNRIRSIFSIRDYLRRLLPHCTMAVAHGQMDEDELQAIMTDFKDGRYDILLSTAIIESGLDIPNANTIIVNRADKTGLADLYQLRGRVGRSTKRAYAYFLIPSFDLITKDALKRLRALQELEELGAGFRLAVHDMEIRGAGDILGKKQSGRINEVGLELYLQMLDEAVREQRYEHGVRPPETVETDVKLPWPAYIPERYIPSTRDRLYFYKMLFGARDAASLDRAEADITDRFGPMPPEVAAFVYQKHLELALSGIGVSSCVVSDRLVTIVFAADWAPPVDVALKLVKKIKGLRYVPPDRFAMAFDAAHGDRRDVKKLLQELLDSVRIEQLHSPEEKT